MNVKSIVYDGTHLHCNKDESKMVCVPYVKSKLLYEEDTLLSYVELFSTGILGEPKEGEDPFWYASSKYVLNFVILYLVETKGQANQKELVFVFQQLRASNFHNFVKDLIEKYPESHMAEHCKELFLIPEKVLGNIFLNILIRLYS